MRSWTVNRRACTRTSRVSFGDPDDLLVRHVPDVGPPVEGERVVLAEREERDRALDHLADPAVRAPAALGGEGGQELGVALVAGRRVEQRPQEPLGGPGGPG